MRLSGLRLRCGAPGQLAEFYRRHFGMKARRDGPGWRVGFAGIDADLVFIPGGSTYQHDRGQRYWKIGVTLPNVDMAYQHLTRAGVSVSTPKQFLDIGYMCHLTDPNGFVIELLQQDFDGNRPAGAGDPKRPLGGGGRIGQITLRTGDIGSDDTCAKALGMTLLSLQDVADYGFDLHFYGYGTETPPQPDLWSVRNREWLWKRPYTLLEFQHIADARFAPVPDFLGIEIEGLDPATSDVVDGEFIAV